MAPRSIGPKAKYGVFWGQGDSRNTIQEVPGATHVAAKIMAMIDAVKVARRHGQTDNLVIYTDYDCPSGFRSRLASYDAKNYFSQQGCKMRNAELLKELYETTKDVKVVFRHRPAVVDKKPNYVIESIIKGKQDVFSLQNTAPREAVLSDGKEPTASTDNWPHVYTTGMLRTSKNGSQVRKERADDDDKWVERTIQKASVVLSPPARELQRDWGYIRQARKTGFKSASYATVWPDKRHGNDTMQRLAMVPVTLFRAQLSAVEDALREAVDNQLPRVVVVCDSQAFLLYWQKNWTKMNGTSAPNKFLYNRIRDLTQAGIDVCFRYENPSMDHPEWSKAMDKCLEALELPLVGKDRSEYDRSLEEVLSKEATLKDSSIQRVRIFKRGWESQTGIVWEDDDGKDFADAKKIEGKTHYALINVLEKVYWELMEPLNDKDKSAAHLLSLLS